MNGDETKQHYYENLNMNGVMLSKERKKAKIDEILQYTVDEWKRKKHKHFKLRLSAGVQSNLNWAKKKHLREKKTRKLAGPGSGVRIF